MRVAYNLNNDTDHIGTDGMFQRLPRGACSSALLYSPGPVEITFPPYINEADLILHEVMPVSVADSPHLMQFAVDVPERWPATCSEPCK